MFKLLFTTLVFSSLLAAAPAMFQVEVSGHGKPMLLIPGLASSGEVWNSAVAHYSNNYECHVFTLAGFAGQPPQAGFSIAGVEAGISAYIADHKFTRPVIVGHSLGLLGAKPCCPPPRSSGHTCHS